MLRNSVVLGGLLAILILAPAAAQDSDQQANCAGLAEAFDGYVANNSDPDLDYAKDTAKQGVDDCNNGRFTQGIAELVTAIGILHDNRPSKWRLHQ
jgi:hypothetical protein